MNEIEKQLRMIFDDNAFIIGIFSKLPDEKDQIRLMNLIDGRNVTSSQVIWQLISLTKAIPTKISYGR